MCVFSHPVIPRTRSAEEAKPPIPSLQPIKIPSPKEEKPPVVCRVLGKSEKDSYCMYVIFLINFNLEYKYYKTFYLPIIYICVYDWIKTNFVVLIFSKIF